MGYKITGTNITLTRGNTFIASVEMRTNESGTQYIPQSGDVIRFALKSSYEDVEPLILKTIPNDTLLLHLEPSDTQDLPCGKYVYDISITYADGEKDTFIENATLVLTKEVY